MGDIRQAQQRGPASRNGPPPGTRVIVDVYADGPADRIAWRHEWKFEDNSLKGTGPIDIPEKKKGEDGTPIQFILNDRTHPKVGLKFVDNDNAIWSDRVACPEHSALWDPEITSISPSQRVLNVVDLNRVKCTLHYNLRFEPDPDRYYYDPEIKNGGETMA